MAEIARHLTKAEPHDSLHVLNLAMAMRNLEGPISAAGVLEFAIDRWPEFNALRIGLAADLCAAGRVEEAKIVLREAFDRDPDLRAVAHDHPGLGAIW